MNVKEYIKQYGKRGAEECEKYLDITPVHTTHNLYIHQICYFEETDEVLAYCLAYDNSGIWIEWNKLSKSAQKNVINALLAFD